MFGQIFQVLKEGQEFKELSKIPRASCTGKILGLQYKREEETRDGACGIVTIFSNIWDTISRSPGIRRCDEVRSWTD